MRTWATLSIVAIAWFAGFGSGWQWRNNSAELEITKLQIEQLEIYTATLKALEETDRQRKSAIAKNDILHAELKEQANKTNQVITKQVIRYVEKNSHSDICQLPNKWVQLHDAAATNSMPTNTSTTGISDDTATRFTATGALETITDNYQSCNDIRIQLLELQAWASEIIYEH